MGDGDPEAEPRTGGGTVARRARCYCLGVLSETLRRRHGEEWDGGERKGCMFHSSFILTLLLLFSH